MHESELLQIQSSFSLPVYNFPWYKNSSTNFGRTGTFRNKGYGEASSIKYYDITVEQMIDELEKKTFVEKFALQNLSVTGNTCIIFT
jgi:hypothetical protein